MSTSAPSTQGWVLADAFDRAAPTYDAMVALSPGYHDQLLGAAGALLDRLPAPDGSALKVLDLGCGSGASTQALLEQWRTRGGAADLLSVTGVDMSEGMVAQARAKSWAAGVQLVVSDAVTYLEALPDDSVDGILAYVRRLGAMVGAAAKAERYAVEAEEHIAAVRQSAAALPRRPRVYFEEWDEPPISTA